jgi:NAD(P)H-flavin reductase
MNPPLPLQPAEIVQRVQETDSIFSLHVKLCDASAQAAYRFEPGQFNMLYVFGAGEIPISIVSDPEHDTLIHHTIRNVGRVSQAMSKLKPGDQIGLRGPYGRGWPMQRCKGKNIVLITGGLGCAPAVSIIHYAMKRRQDYGKLTILQGVKKSCDMIWRQHYDAWAAMPNTQVLLAADVMEHGCDLFQGPVTHLIASAHITPGNTIAMLCGPERMMQVACNDLLKLGLATQDIFVSMERNMQCAVGQCGHCQYGKHFVCKNGPVFALNEIAGLMQVSHY